MGRAFAPPPGSRRIRTLEAHTGGEPLRIFVEGFPEPEGDTILAKRRFARRHLDDLRRAVMWEPRGHADMYGALPVPPVTPDGDVGVLFLHNEGWSTMCGHGIIGLVQAGLEYGLFSTREPDVIRIDTPAGRVVARARRDGERVATVTFQNVPSFLALSDARVKVELPEGGAHEVCFDLGYGGAFYAYAEAASLGLSLDPQNASR